MLLRRGSWGALLCAVCVPLGFTAAADGVQYGSTYKGDVRHIATHPRCSSALVRGRMSPGWQALRCAVPERSAHHRDCRCGTHNDKCADAGAPGHVLWRLQGRRGLQLPGELQAPAGPGLARVARTALC